MLTPAPDPTATPEFDALLRRKGHYVGHVFAQAPEEELRWLWRELHGEVFAPYAFVNRLTLQFELAYNDNYWAPQDGLNLDGVALQVGGRGEQEEYFELLSDYAADKGHTTFPYGDALLEPEDEYEVSEVLFPDPPGGGYDEAYFVRRTAFLDEHYGHYRAPLARAYSLLGAILHDFEEGYFLWLFGVASEVVFTRTGVEIGGGGEFGLPWDGQSTYYGLAAHRKRSAPDTAP